MNGRFFVADRARMTYQPRFASPWEFAMAVIEYIKLKGKHIWHVLLGFFLRIGSREAPESFRGDFRGCDFCDRADDPGVLNAHPEHRRS